MLLTNRHYRFLSIFLAGMEIACFLPLFWLGWLYIQAQQEDGSVLALSGDRFPNLFSDGYSPIVLVGFCLLLWLLYLLALDLINMRSIDSPRRELFLFGTMVLSTALLVRIFLYPTAGLFDFGWIAALLNAIFNFTDGWRFEMVIILLNLFLWVRVVLSLGRPLTFMSVGLSFRLSLLLGVLGNSILYSIIGLSVPLQFFVLLLGFGLLAVALARIDEKSIVGQHSAGTVISWGRLGLLGLATAIALAIGLLWAGLYTPENIRTALGWFSPLWLFLGTIAMSILSALFWLLAPLLDWLITTLQGMMEGLEIFEVQQETGSGELEPIEPESVQSLTEVLQNWTIVRYCLVTGGIVLFMVFLWIFFVRPYLRQLNGEAEEVEQDQASLGLGGLRSGLDRLRDLAKLVGRFGLSLDLLDAISIENMYANLSRIARQRGYPRQPNQPPDDYINQLREAFPGQADGLHRITSAYMRVHYGDQAINRDELSRLREIYDVVRNTAEGGIEPE